MKRTRRDRVSRPAAGGPRRGQSRRVPGIAWVGGLLVVAGLVVAGAILMRGRPRQVTPPHPADAMDAARADSEGYARVLAGDYWESLPYYRRVLRDRGDAWMPHANYSSALHNAAQDSRLHLGRLEPAVRSSLERVRLIGVSLDEEDLAEIHAQGHDRAVAIYLRGQTLETWGFPLDALSEYRRALGVAPEDTAIRQVVTNLDRLLASGGLQ